MSEKFQPVRGTQDLLSPVSDRFDHIFETTREVAGVFNCRRIDTPIFEFSEVFHRSLGETSDAVSKETYTFTDRGGEGLTLRPEGTAGIARAFLSNGLAQDLPLKLYYHGPMFRYERPQKGRYRQFHQVGVEYLGFEAPWSDVECISMAHRLLGALGLRDAVQLEINSLGDAPSRGAHREALVSYLQDFRAQLSEDSKVRLEKNPLRILDSKDAGDRTILQKAPVLTEFLNPSSQDFFFRVREGLENLGIAFTVNPKLVRGLDYYTHTVFEFVTDQLGAQGAVVAGGRYDGLIASMGGPHTPSIGWASGVERLSLLLENRWQKPASALLAVIPGDDARVSLCSKTSFHLREAGLAVELLEPGSLGKRLKKATKLGAHFAIIIGESEAQLGVAAVKNLASGEQKNIELAKLAEALKRDLSPKRL